MKLKRLVLRAPADVVARIDDIRALVADAVDRRVSRSAVARLLLARGLRELKPGRAAESLGGESAIATATVKPGPSRKPRPARGRRDARAPE